MAEICSCSENLGNTGVVACLGDIKNAKMLFVVPTFDSTGAKNKLLITTTMDQTWLDARINDTDKSKRWRPINNLENVSDTIADTTFETAASGRKARIRTGVRSFFAELWGSSVAAPEYLGILKRMHCTDMSVYIVDLDNNFIGAVPATEDGYLYPIRIDKNSWDAKMLKATDTTIAKNTLSFDFHVDERDEQLRYVPESEYTADIQGAEGLLDIYSEIVSCGQTSLVIDLYTRFGTAKTKTPLVGLVAADFFDTVGGTASRLYNVTDSLAVTISALTESPDGRYTLTYASQTVSDVIRITPDKNGYDFENVVDTTATVV